jgi:hypothetical protein
MKGVVPRKTKNLFYFFWGGGGLQTITKKFTGISCGAGWYFKSSSITEIKGRIFSALKNLYAVPQY